MKGQPEIWPPGERPIGREFLYSSDTTGLPKGIRRSLIPFLDRRKPEFDMSWKGFYGFDADTVYLSPALLYHAAHTRLWCCGVCRAMPYLLRPSSTIAAHTLAASMFRLALNFRRTYRAVKPVSCCAAF